MCALVDLVFALGRRRQSARVAPSHQPGASLPPYPLPGTHPLHNRFGGRAWRYDLQGVYADGLLWRTPGEPVTCRAILENFREPILAAAAKHRVNPALIVMTIAVEAGNLRQWGFTGPRSFRWEARVRNDDVGEAFRGSYSAGPMQVLATTARRLVVARGSDFNLDYAPFALAPAYPTPPHPVPARHPMYAPPTSIDLGAAVIRLNSNTTGDDPILVAAVYNSGGLYQSAANAWRLRSHANHLDRAARWYGDACAELSRLGLI